VDLVLLDKLVQTSSVAINAIQELQHAHQMHVELLQMDVDQQLVAQHAQTDFVLMEFVFHALPLLSHFPKMFQVTLQFKLQLQLKQTNLDWE